MKSCKRLEAEGFYILGSKATANSTYFEDEEDIRRFVGIMKSKFRGVFRIYDYMCKADGWIFAVKLYDEEKVKHRFSAFKEDIELWEVWQIVSELMRQSLSQYVRSFNRRHGRQGAGVRARYERYIFETKGELLGYLQCLREAEVDVSQESERYRPSERLYLQLARLEREHEILSSKWKVDRRVAVEEIWGELIDFQIVTGFVVDNWMKNYQKITYAPHPIFSP